MKIGDMVMRKFSEHMGMKRGDIATITQVNIGTVNLKEFAGRHSKDNLEVIHNIPWRRRLGD